MTPVETMRGESVALFGLGGSGLSTARALVAGGAEIAAWDDSPAAREHASAAGIALVDLAEAEWRGFRLFVLAPGVPLTHPAPHWTVNLADAAGVLIVGDIELFTRERGARAPDAQFVAITGTNGKSTTTALIAHVLAEAGRDVAMGGNIGVPVLDLPPPAAGRTHVVECSSYQIDLAPSLAPSVGLLTNITPDHLDRHGDLARYAAIKERLVAHSEVALVGVDDEPCREIYARLRARAGAPRVMAVSGNDSEFADVWVSGHRVMARGEAAPAADLKPARALRGAHNGQNAAFAYAAARTLGVEREQIARAFASFPGLAHRMEEVGRLGPVLFINDSTATNADAAEKALMSFRDIHWILGGRPKAGGIEPLRPLFPRIARAYLIGEAAD
ncbi:MAG TPA: UDP-N-acetylmuramoyl-L-alanine--D-glutamate ligase, partial [Roseiarcus sp.]